MRKILRLVVPVILLVFLIVLLFNFQKIRTQLQSKASGPSTAIIGNHGLPGDLWSDIVIGQIDFNQSGPDQVVPFKVFNPGGVIIDRSRRPNTVYVYDGGNSRILIHTSLGVCQNDASIKCTTHSDCPNSLCSFTSAKPADFVIGQPSATNYNGCNGDANMQNYPHRSPARADSLCSIPEMQPSPMEGGSFASMAIDQNHNLYVTDFFNNRVLKYIDPVATDRIADEVWGQDDMTGKNCNKIDPDLAESDPPNPTASSLCMGRNRFESFVAGVDIDLQGNLWVADSSNHRVLRFPSRKGTISKTADLVLGQQSFITRGNGTDPTQMDQPAALRLDPTTGWLYVADKGNNRVSIFKPPFTSGMAAQTFGSQFYGPASIDFDPSGSGIWISDNLNSMLELWNMTGTTVQKVLFKDTYQPNGTCGTQTPSFVCKNPQPGGKCWDNMCDVRGSVGIDSDGNILVASKSTFNQDVWRFVAPIPSPELGKTISADYRLMYPPDAGYNYPSDKGLYAPRSVVVKNNQLIISDGRKIRFWNNPQDLTNGQAADGYIGVGVNSFQDSDPWTIQRIAADNQNHLWVARYSTIDVYQLPLTTGAQPIKTAISFANGLPVLGGGQISWSFDDQFWGIDVDPSGNFLWLTQVDPINRVIRVRDPFTNPVVDVILGQKDVTGTACNRGLTTAQNDTLCYPGAVKLDRLGNAWVSDHGLEVSGNYRMLMFDATLFTNITNMAIFAPPASLVSPKMLPWEPAFDSKNRMVVGYNAYLSPPDMSHFAGIYNNPIQSLTTSAIPDMFLKDLFSQAYAATFDEFDNLYIADLNRGRVLIYKTLPPPNSPPTITTDTLPVGLLRKPYQATITATDPDVSDTLTATITGLPPKLKVSDCQQTSTTTTHYLNCTISGTPTKLGIFPVKITVTDTANNKVTSTLKLYIHRR
ncbi:hypothetical protein HYU91_04000 [Candidatus Collierbacteria bacterium]|nr:hypothetical protein [Candidatus Collierbacteria bacterium]